LTSHIVGFIDYDLRKGLAGAEAMLDHRGASAIDPLQLSIDVRVQTALREELLHARGEFIALVAAGVVLDARTSEVLALVSLPDFDPGDRRSIDPNGYRDHISDSVYELGGIFETFALAQAPERRTVTSDTLIDATTALYIGAAAIRDDDLPARPLRVADVFSRSSVVGSARIAGRSSAQAQQAFLRRLGLLDPMSVEFAEPAPRPLVNLQTWTDYTRSTVAYGYGIAVTPLQAAVAATAIANHGILVQPTILKRAAGSPIAGARVLSEEASAQMRNLFRLAVSAGTGTAADVPTYQAIPSAGRRGRSRNSPDPGTTAPIPSPGSLPPFRWMSIRATACSSCLTSRTGRLPRTVSRQLSGTRPRLPDA
jgi:cell division protein FtsI (penicillin-binding protein 3)